MNTLSAKDLRIGNLVYIDNELLPETANKAFTVLGIEGRNDKDFPNSDSVVRLNRDGSWVHYAQYIEFVRPIELTEDWLLKANWKYQDRDVNRSDKKTERFYISPFFGEHREYWIELQLSNNKLGKSFMWLMWDIGGGNHFIHFPYGHKMDYLHQLQNLYFALTGNELTFDK